MRYVSRIVNPLGAKLSFCKKDARGMKYEIKGMPNERVIKKYTINII